MKIAHSGVEHPAGKGCYWDEHVLRNGKTMQEIPLPQWEWADVDKNKLLWAKAGKLFSGSVDKTDSDFVEKEIFDFNGVHFEPVAAPY